MLFCGKADLSFKEGKIDKEEEKAGGQRAEALLPVVLHPFCVSLCKSSTFLVLRTCWSLILHSSLSRELRWLCKHPHLGIKNTVNFDLEWRTILKCQPYKSKNNNNLKKNLVNLSLATANGIQYRIKHPDHFKMCSDFWNSELFSHAGTILFFCTNIFNVYFTHVSSFASLILNRELFLSSL